MNKELKRGDAYECNNSNPTEKGVKIMATATELLARAIKVQTKQEIVIKLYEMLIKEQNAEQRKLLLDIIEKLSK